MDRTADCPMCGEKMRLVDRETTDRIPGRPQVVRRTVHEWVCPECDYFEEEGTRPESGR